MDEPRPEPKVTPGIAYNAPGAAGFLPGNPGKPKGAKAKRTREGEAFARAWCDANAAAILNEITTNGDIDQKFRALQFFFDHAHGRPIQRVDVDLDAEARKLAERAGVSTEELLATAEAIVAGDTN